MNSSENKARVEHALGNLVGLRLFKSWNVFATRMFYFAEPDFSDFAEDGEYRLTVECPWRIEQNGTVFVGSEDYGIPASGNANPDWDPVEMQRGHLQDERLTELLGAENGGTICNTGSSLVVESVKADPIGGFHILLSGGCNLAIFPASAVAMEWLLSKKGGGNISMVNGLVAG